MNLSALRVQSGTVIAKSVAAVTDLSLFLWYVTARRTRAIVVMDTQCRWFFNFVNGIEVEYSRHGISPSVPSL